MKNKLLSSITATSIGLFLVSIVSAQSPNKIGTVYDVTEKIKEGSNKLGTKKIQDFDNGAHLVVQRGEERLEYVLISKGGKSVPPTLAAKASETITTWHINGCTIVLIITNYKDGKSNSNTLYICK